MSDDLWGRFGLLDMWAPEATTTETLEVSVPAIAGVEPDPTPPTPTRRAEREAGSMLADDSRTGLSPAVAYVRRPAPAATLDQPPGWEHDEPPVPPIVCYRGPGGGDLWLVHGVEVPDPYIRLDGDVDLSLLGEGRGLTGPISLVKGQPDGVPVLLEQRDAPYRRYVNTTADGVQVAEFGWRAEGGWIADRLDDPLVDTFSLRIDGRGRITRIQAGAQVEAWSQAVTLGDLVRAS